ncbi:hypothetical protein BpHYR1_034117, partial [Brachionus plicatilis]
MFSNNLAEIFKPETHTFVYEDNLELLLPITNPDPISTDEFLSSLKTLNTKAAPGINQISNKVFKNCPDTELQTAISAIEKYCLIWGLKSNVSKTVYTVFTTAGYRKNYEKNYQLTLKINASIIPIDPSPRFLGHILDPKLSFRMYKSFIRSQLDFMFIAIKNSAQK